MRGWTEMRERFSQLGQKINADKKEGKSNPADKAAYKQLNDFMRDASTTRRHNDWWKVYKPAYDKALDVALYDGLTDKQARKRARREAEDAVREAFPSIQSRRAVRDALDYLRDEPL